MNVKFCHLNKSHTLSRKINASWNHRKKFVSIVALIFDNVSFGDLNFHYFGPKFLMHSSHSWHLRKRGILSRWRSTRIGETLKNFRNGQISSLDPLRTFRESIANKFFISDYSLNSVPVFCVKQFCFFVYMALIFFIFWESFAIKFVLT